jgi:hypothetical protein
VAPIRIARPTAPRGVGILVVACAMLWRAEASGQSVAALDPNALVPRLQTDSRNPPRFQKFDREELARLAQLPKFAPPAAGASTTGFDSSNSRKAKAKTKPKTPAGAQAIAPGLPAPLAVSPYQKSAADSAATPTAPGAPPVALGPIRTVPKKRKAHTEPEDPYAPLGVDVGAFDLYPAVELIGGYDTNPEREPGDGGARLYTVAPELRAQ